MLVDKLFTAHISLIERKLGVCSAQERREIIAAVIEKLKQGLGRIVILEPCRAIPRGGRARMPRPQSAEGCGFAPCPFALTAPR